MTTWGFRLYGQFEHIARSRADWWANSRTDLAVWVCEYVDGRGWIDVELISPDVYAGVTA